MWFTLTSASYVRAELISTLTKCSSVQAGAAAGITLTTMQRLKLQKQDVKQTLLVTHRRCLQAVGRTCQVYRYDARFHGDSDKPEWVTTSHKGVPTLHFDVQVSQVQQSTL